MLLFVFEIVCGIVVLSDCIRYALAVIYGLTEEEREDEEYKKSR